MAGSVKDLAIYRSSCAVDDLETAKELLDLGKYKQFLNRSYYSIFHSMRAVNALDQFDSKKHSGVIAHFNQHHVKTGEFPREVSRIIRMASDMRENADYEDFFLASRQEAEEQIRNAEIFVKYVMEYLKKRDVTV